MIAKTHCFSCGAEELTEFYESHNIPVNSCLLMPTRQEALDYPRGDLRLAFCRGCGFIQNVLFDPGVIEYSDRYEETQGYSARFNQFNDSLAARLVKCYDLKDKDVLEIGCGKGEFLVSLMRMGAAHGLGIDPGVHPERMPEDVASKLDFITDFYSDQYLHLTADFIACRHTLEHIQPVRDFVDLVRRAIGERRDPIVFFEVPDVVRVLRELAFWDIYYEHCSYFSLGSLARLFRAAEFDVFDLRAEYDDQYLLIDAVAANGSEGPYWDTEDDMAHLTNSVAYFRDNHKSKLAEWRRALQKANAGGQKTVLWGSGSKAVSYITSTGINDELEFVVDINPHKWGKFLAGSGHQIVSPEFLSEYQPDSVIAMNPIYLDEIDRSLQQLGVVAELTSV